MTYRPAFQKEGPASPCVFHGQDLKWKNCTCLSFAMGIDKSTHGRVKMSGCDVRVATNDWAGGTTIEQCAAVAGANGVHVEVRTGTNVVSPYYLGVQVQSGRGFSIAGNTQPLGKGNVNHNVWGNEVTGGTLGHPANVYVFDPWSAGPAWWSWSKLISFARALHPWGEQDPRTLANMGINGVYTGIFPDTEGSLWGSDVPKDIQAIDPDGRLVADVFRKLRLGYGTVINMVDLDAAFKQLHHNYGAVINPVDVQWLINWGNTH